jgi:peroxiredoxin
LIGCYQEITIMALTPSNMLPLGTLAPGFNLPGTDGRHHALSDFAGKPLVVAFICNHCPFVKHIRHELAAMAREYQARGVSFVAINANDVAAYPADDMAHMQQEVEEAGYVFPYLLDESQAIARAYDAACTPDFYLFDAAHKLVYRGQMDASRPKLDIPVTGADLRAAMDAVLAGIQPNSEQMPSIGCNIKWKPGNAPV